MRRIVLGCVALAVGCSASEPAFASPTKGVRTVQVIVMRPVRSRAKLSGDLKPAPSGEAQADATARNPALSQLTETFRAHDLSRRWVAFEMANSFSSATGAGLAPETGDADLVAPVGVAQPGQGLPPPALLPAPVMIIPRWMRNGMAFSSAPTSFAPGCAPGGYRPSGFLDPRTEGRRLGYYGIMSSIACEYGIPIGLFDAMIIRESGYQASIYSAKNAFGLTQLMPDTAAGMGVNRYDVEQNLRGGARYLRQQLDRFGQVHLALAAYNAGPGRVRDGMLPRIAETQAYVENVLLNWRRLAGFSPTAAVQNVTARPALRVAPNARIATVSSY